MSDNFHNLPPAPQTEGIEIGLAEMERRIAAADRTQRFEHSLFNRAMNLGGLVLRKLGRKHDEKEYVY